ncbi:MAG: RsmD family RNA methyltransferase [Bacteroidota bacterium]
MRIIRGILKSRRFSTPKNFPSRPTTDFAKEGIFNILENRYSLQDLEILDLCSGTGNISLEFASREAGKITSVDTNYNCVKFIQNLINEHNLKDVMQVYKADVRDFLRKSEKKWDLIFADPPYAMNFHQEMLDIIVEKKMLKENGICIIEHGRQTDLRGNKSFTEMRSFGNVHFSFFSEIE